MFIILGTLIAAYLITQEKQKPVPERDIGVFTEPNKVEVQKGKVIEVAPQVKQISAAELHTALAGGEDLTVIQVFTGDEWREPHIKGTVFIRSSEFDYAPNLDKEKSYVYVSSDGYDSAEAIAKLVRFGFSVDKNVNLDGGLAAWKEKGFKYLLQFSA